MGKKGKKGPAGSQTRNALRLKWKVADTMGVDPPTPKEDGVQGEEACQPVVAGHGWCQLSQDTLILLLRIRFPFAVFTICFHPL